MAQIQDDRGDYYTVAPDTLEEFIAWLEDQPDAETDEVIKEDEDGVHIWKASYGFAFAGDKARNPVAQWLFTRYAPKGATGPGWVGAGAMRMLADGRWFAIFVLNFGENPVFALSPRLTQLMNDLGHGWVSRQTVLERSRGVQARGLNDTW